jgi:hypothetical protein
VPSPLPADAARLRRRRSRRAHSGQSRRACDDGIYVTDLATGTSRLLASTADIFAQAFPTPGRAKYARGDFYGFHVKWNPQGTRLLFVLRWIPRTWLPWKRKKSHRRLNVVTLDADGSNPRIAVDDTTWRKGGNHPNWCPDGEHVLMNLNTGGDGLRFARIRRDGTASPPCRPRFGAPDIRRCIRTAITS